MRFGLDARMRDVVNFRLYSETVSCFVHLARDIQNGKLLRELVVHSAFPFGRRVETGQFNAANGVANSEESWRLATLVVYRQGLADSRLHAKPIQDRAEHFVVIQTIDQGFVQSYFVRHRAVDDALVQVRGAKPPDFAGKHHVMAVMDFGEVIKGAGLFGEGYEIAPPVVLDIDIAFFDVDVWSAVFPHSTELDQVAIRVHLPDGDHDLQCAHALIHLSEY